jgi:GNAT superfamily N-acetyltransferase
VIGGGGRYVALQPTCQGEVTGAALMRHIVAIAREAGLKKRTAAVLPDDISMLKSLQRADCP